MADFKGVDYLRSKLISKRGRVMLRYSHYEMKHLAMDFGISTPPELRQMMGVLGWCSRAVDALADRLSFQGFENDAYGLTNIYAMNNQDVLVDSAILGALISSCDFIYIAAGSDGFPVMRVIDGRHATGIIDPITNMLKEGYAVIEFDEFDQPLTEAYFVPGMTTIMEKGKKPYEVRNSAPYPLLVPIIYRPDATRPFGHSRISRACMEIVDSAVRTVKRSEIAAEFYSYPQKYILGMDENAEQMDKWRATMSSMLRIDKDEDGDKPSVGQFQMAAQTPHTEQLRGFAGLFAGETGLTLDDLGFPSQNPSSSEAIKAAHESLRLTARKAQKTFGTGLLNAGYLAACVRDHVPYQRRQLYRTRVLWDPLFEPDLSSLSGVGDAVQKIQTSFPEYFTESKLKELTGI
jgi:hypothetical protein